MEPQEVASREFTISFRGWAREDVHAFLAVAASELAARDARIAELEAELAQWRAESRSGSAGSPATGSANGRIVRSELIELLGHETAAILAGADEEARTIRTSAESKVARLARDLRSIGEQMRASHARLGDMLESVRSMTEAETEIRLPAGGATPSRASPETWLS